MTFLGGANNISPGALAARKSVGRLSSWRHGRIWVVLVLEWYLLNRTERKQQRYLSFVSGTFPHYGILMYLGWRSVLEDLGVSFSGAF